jgi:hypothetical protein
MKLQSDGWNWLCVRGIPAISPDYRYNLLLLPPLTRKEGEISDTDPVKEVNIYCLSNLKSKQFSRKDLRIIFFFLRFPPSELFLK